MENEIKTTMVESIDLADDETLAEFLDLLREAVKGVLKPSGGMWGIEAVGDGWCVAVVVSYSEDGATADRFRLEFRRVKGEIQIGASSKVKRRVVYDPEAKKKGEDVKDCSNLVGETQGLYNAIATDDCSKCEAISYDAMIDGQMLGQRFEFTALEDTCLIEDVKIFEAQEGQVQEAAPFEVTDADFVSPSGERYIAVLVGFGAMDSVINLNRRLYDPNGEENQPGMEQNVTDQQRMISAAFKSKTASMGSELDHPEGGPTFKGLATELIDAKRVGVRVAIKEGVLGTSEGQNLKIAAAHGFPIGKSTLSRGTGERRVMSKDNAFFSLNAAHEGEVYDHIFGFQIEQYDTVRHPSALVFSQMKRSEVSREVRDAFDALLCEDGTCPIDGKCADGSTPKPPIVEVTKVRDITTPEPKLTPQETEKMDETQVKQLIADAVAESNEANVELKATVDSLGEKVAATETALAEAKTANEKLTDDLRDARAVADVARNSIVLVVAERDAVVLDKQLRDAVTAHCEAKEDEIEPIRAKRATYIGDMAERFEAPVGKDDEGKARIATAEEMADAIKTHVEACSERFDRVVGPGLSELHEAANRRVITDDHTKVQHKPGHGYAGDAIPMSFSKVEKPQA